MRNRVRFLAGASLIAFTATAQPQMARAAAPAGKLEEVVVTAQRRRQNVQKAPVVISVISSATIANAGVNNAVDLSRLVVSTQFAAASAPYPLLYIRGVGSLTGTSFTDSAVAISYDGVPLARTYEGLGQYYDLDRVEVLVGPQGTLYGRNATGGAVNILPTAPRLGETSGYLGVDYGNYNTLEFSGAGNLAIASNAALRIAFHTNRNDAYYSENAGSADDAAVRTQLRFDPTADISTVTDFDYYHIGGSGTTGVSASGKTVANILVAPGHVLSFQASTAGFDVNEGISATDPRMIPLYAAQGLTAPVPGGDTANNAFYGFQTTINWQTPFGTATLIPAYRHGSLNYLSYGAGFGLSQDETDEQESVEARFASKENQAFKWIVGAFYLHDHVDSRQGVDDFEPAFLGISQYLNFTSDTRSAAPFIDGTYSISPTLRLLAGARYTVDWKKPTGGAVSSSGDVVSLDGTPTHSWDALTYRGGVQWDVAPQSMLYATYATGWHSGGFFITHDDPIYQPEKLDAVTLGSKNRFLDGRLQANLELFYWKYRNQQVNFVTLDSAGSSQFVTKNIGESTRTGADLDLQYQLTPSTTLGVQGEYLDAEYQSYRYSVPAFLSPNTGCQVTNDGGPNFVVDCAHTRVPYAPRWTANLSLRQDFPLANAALITAIVRTHSQTANDTGTQDVPVEMQNSYTTVDASLGYTAPNNRWSLVLYGENITDRQIKTQVFQNPASGILGAHQGIYFATLHAPAQYGFRARVNF